MGGGGASCTGFLRLVAVFFKIRNDVHDLVIGGFGFAYLGVCLLRETGGDWIALADDWEGKRRVNDLIGNLTEDLWIVVDVIAD